MIDQERIVLELAGIPIAIQGRWGANHPFSRTAFEHFLSSGSADTTISVAESGMDGLPPGEGELIFEVPDHWTIYGDSEQYRLVQWRHDAPGIANRVLIVRRDFSHGSFFARSPIAGAPHASPHPNPLNYPLGEIFMVWLLAQGRGLMIHGCAIETEGRGLLFAGNSGHGKSTLAKLWAHTGRVLNDDRTAIRNTADGYIVFPTPWHGEHGFVSTGGAHLDSIFIIKHGAGNRVRRLGALEASSMLLTRSFLPLWDKQGMDFALGFAARLVNRIPCWELAFQSDDSVVDFLQSHLRSRPAVRTISPKSETCAAKASEQTPVIECDPIRLSAFFKRSTDRLLVPGQQDEMISIFRNLIEMCFSRPNCIDQWKSPLSADGTPFDFSMSLGNDDVGSFRFLADVTVHPDGATRSVPVMKRLTDQVVPYCAESRDMIDHLFEVYLEGRKEFPRNTIALGARFSPGKDRGGRVYFGLRMGSLDTLDRMLRVCKDDHTPTVVRQLPPFRDKAFGFCCDFSANGLAAIKVYAFVEALSQSTVRDLLHGTLEKVASRLDDLLDLVCGFKESPWTVPQTIVGISFGGRRKICRIDLHIPLMAWDWPTFSCVRPAISAIFTRWGFSAISPASAESDFMPPWRFSPTILSIGTSEDGGEDLAVYFKPEKFLRVDAVQKPAEIEQGREISEDLPPFGRQQISGSAAFTHMFAELLRAESGR